MLDGNAANELKLGSCCQLEVSGSKYPDYHKEVGLNMPKVIWLARTNRRQKRDIKNQKLLKLACIQRSFSNCIGTLPHTFRTIDVHDVGGMHFSIQARKWCYDRGARDLHPAEGFGVRLEKHDIR